MLLSAQKAVVWRQSFFFFQAEDGIRDVAVTGVQTCALPIFGKQAIDDDSNQAGQMIAEMLGWPQATFASKIEFAAEKCTVVREVDGGLETIAFALPAVVTTDLRLNEPRYASLPGIMKARKKPLNEIAVDSLGVDLTPKLRIKRLQAPDKRQA